MKYILSIILVSLILAGCGEKKEQKQIDNKNKYAYDSTDIKAAPVDNPSQSFELRYKFEKGKDYKYRLTMISHDTQTIKADTLLGQNVKQSIIYLMDFNVVDLDKDGTFEIGCNINSVKLEAEANGRYFNYESGVTKDSSEIEKYAEYAALINNPFSARVSKLGEVIEIFRADKIANKFLELKHLADSAKTEQKNQLRRDMIEGALRPMLIQVFRQMPEKSVAKDSVWTFAQNVSQFLVFKMQNTNTYKVNSLEKYNGDKIAVLDAGLNTVITGDTKLNERGVSYEFKKPVTKASGTIYFNITKGLVQKSKTKTSVNIFYTMKMTTPKGTQKGSKTEDVENINILEFL